MPGAAGLPPWRGSAREIAAGGRATRVSRYFKYKSSQDLLADARALGLDVDLSEDLSPLFRPIEIGGRRVGNRLAIQPMEGCDGELDGSPGELTFRRYRRFGAGGAKLIWGEAAAVVPEGRANPRQLVIDAATAPALGALLRETRQAHVAAIGTRRRPPRRPAAHPLGPLLVPRPILAQHDPLLDPRTIVDKATGRTVGPDDPLHLRRRARPAPGPLRRGRRAGVPDRLRLRRPQAVPPLPAQRAAGGADAPGQVRRLAREPDAIHPRGRRPDPLRASRRDHRHPPERLRRRPLSERAPTDRGPLPVHDCRCTRSGGPTWTTRREPDLAEPLALVGWLRDLGVGLINVSIGNPYASPHLLRPFEYPPPGRLRDARAPADRRGPPLPARRRTIQAAYPELPIVGSGYSWLQAFAFEAGAANVAAGPDVVRRDRPRRAVPARFRPSPGARRAARPQADLPHVQLLHGPDAIQAQRAGPVRHRLPAVRQGGLRADLGRGTRIRPAGRGRVDR